MSFKPNKMDIIKLFRKFKLSESLFRGQYSVIKESLPTDISQNDLNNIVKRKIAEQISDYILKTHQSAIVKNEKAQTIEYNVELFAIKTGDLNAFIEAVIQELSQSEIDWIKSGSQVLTLGYSRP